MAEWAFAWHVTLTYASVRDSPEGWGREWETTVYSVKELRALVVDRYRDPAIVGRRWYRYRPWSVSIPPPARPDTSCSAAAKGARRTNGTAASAVGTSCCGASPAGTWYWTRHYIPAPASRGRVE